MVEPTGKVSSSRKPDTGGKDIFVHISAVQRAGMKNVEGRPEGHLRDPDAEGRTSVGRELGRRRLSIPRIWNRGARVLLDAGVFIWGNISFTEVREENVRVGLAGLGDGSHAVAAQITELYIRHPAKAAIEGQATDTSQVALDFLLSRNLRKREGRGPNGGPGGIYFVAAQAAPSLPSPLGESRVARGARQTAQSCGPCIFRLSPE